MAEEVSRSSAAAAAGIEAERVRQLREVDTFGARHVFVGAHDGEGQHVEVTALGVAGHAGDDLGQRSPRSKLVIGRHLDAGASRLGGDRQALGVAERAVGIGGRCGEAHEAGHGRWARPAAATVAAPGDGVQVPEAPEDIGPPAVAGCWARRWS